jgi:hypothetical protein
MTSSNKTLDTLVAEEQLADPSLSGGVAEARSCAGVCGNAAALSR